MDISTLIINTKIKCSAFSHGAIFDDGEQIVVLHRLVAAETWQRLLLLPSSGQLVKNSFAFNAVQSGHIRIKQENDNGTQTAQYAVQTHFEYWISPIPRISKYWILQYIQNQKYQNMASGARSTSRANARSLGLVSLRPQRIGNYHQFTHLMSGFNRDQENLELCLLYKKPSWPFFRFRDKI